MNSVIPRDMSLSLIGWAIRHPVDFTDDVFPSLTADTFDDPVHWQALELIDRMARLHIAYGTEMDSFAELVPDDLIDAELVGQLPGRISPAELAAAIASDDSWQWEGDELYRMQRMPSEQANI